MSGLRTDGHFSAATLTFNASGMDPSLLAAYQAAPQYAMSVFG